MLMPQFRGIDCIRNPRCAQRNARFAITDWTARAAFESGKSYLSA